VFKVITAFLAFCISRIARVFRADPEVVVLMYHAVDSSGWKLAVTPEMFEQQVQYIAHNGLGTSLREVVAYIKGEREFTRQTVAITFDDGYRDLLTTVLPILEKYNVPATVFVPSDLSAHTDPQHTPRLTEEELHTLAQSPLITIGSHAKTHRKFTELSEGDMRSEAEESATALRHILGARPRFFAYPFGARSQDAERVVHETGYEASFSISEGTIRPGDDLFRLKRVQIDGTMSFFLFKLRLTSALDWNRRIVRVFRSLA
jgi:peptidoglycan/xylan/chitin deacetylase (PgdA/CDA1 family)